MSFRRIAAWGGFVTFVLGVLNIILTGDSPFPDAAISDVGEYLASNEGMHKAASVVGHLLGAAVAVFFAGLVLRIWSKERGGDTGWALVVLFGVVLAAAAAAVGDAANAALVWRGGDGLGAESAQALFDLQNLGYSATGLGFGVLIGGAAFAGQKYELWPNWLQWLSWIGALLGLVSVVAFLDDGLAIFGLIGFAAFLIWTAATSWVMYKEG